MFIPLIRIKPTQEGSVLPLFMVQLPQKTFSRLGFSGRAWEVFLQYCMGIDFRKTDLLNTFIDLKTYSQILVLGMRVFGPERLLRWYVEDTAPSHLGPIGMAVSTAPTLGEALQVWLRHGQLMAPHIAVDIHETQRDMVIQYHSLEDLGQAHPLYRELSLFLTRRKLLDLSSNKAEVRVRFGHPPMLAPEWYVEAFGLQPEMGSCDSLIIERRWLEHENEAYTPMLYQRALEECEVLLQNVQQRCQVRHQVRTLLLEGSHHNRFYNLDQVADQLNVSPRTLTRRLSEEGTSFRDILSELRLEIAKHQLQQTRLPIKTICSNAGFTNMSAFSRAFRRYTQSTPSDFRHNA